MGFGESVNKFSAKNYKFLYAFYFNSNYFSQSKCYIILILRIEKATV